jgi:hypothetical protein
VVKKLRLTGDTVRNLKVIILNDELAPSKVEVRLTVLDSLAELLSYVRDYEKHFLLVGFEFLCEHLRVHDGLLVPDLSDFENVLNEGNGEWKFQICSNHHQNTDMEII